MAAPFFKRRAGLIAILKNNLGTVAPKLCNIGLITKTENEVATDYNSNRRERAEALVAAIGRKIKTDESQLRAFLGILRETRVGHIYVTIMEREAKNLNGNGTDTGFASSFDRDSHVVVNRHDKEKSNGREDKVVAVEDVEEPPPQLQRYVRVQKVHLYTHMYRQTQHPTYNQRVRSGTFYVVYIYTYTDLSSLNLISRGVVDWG